MAKVAGEKLLSEAIKERRSNHALIQAWGSLMPSSDFTAKEGVRA
jgi:hypothetical protein